MVVFLNPGDESFQFILFTLSLFNLVTVTKVILRVIILSSLSPGFLTTCVTRLHVSVLHKHSCEGLNERQGAYYGLDELH